MNFPLIFMMLVLVAMATTAPGPKDFLVETADAVNLQLLCMHDFYERFQQRLKVNSLSSLTFFIFGQKNTILIIILAKEKTVQNTNAYSCN